MMSKEPSTEQTPGLPDSKGRVQAEFRPSYHFLAPHGWMNDPCAPAYDEKTGIYHLFYQWNPHNCEWNNISWGHAISKDLVHWEYKGASPVLIPDREYDCKGVFTGCFYPTGLHGEQNQLSVIYTSVCHLPIHWTIPYVRGSEGVSAAVSSDGGETWEKSPHNPLLAEEPGGIHVTGWRDPFISRWATLDHVRGERESLYGLVSGGVHGKGPTSFLYSLNTSDLTKWNYLGPLFDFVPNFRPSKKWGGDFGTNLECTNFISLGQGQATQDFIITGSEGGREREWVVDGYTSSKIPRRVPRYCLWFAGSSVHRDTGISFNYEFGGLLDHGIYYAANSFHDAAKNRRVVWGWLIEEDMTIEFHKAKGWNGCLGLPRELFLNIIPNVTQALISPIEDIGSVKVVPEADRSVSLHTLGIRPLPELATLRVGEAVTIQNLSVPTTATEHVQVLPIKSRHFELCATVLVGPGCERVGIEFHCNSTASTSASVLFVPQSEEIVVNRSKTNRLPDANRCEEKGPFTLFTQNVNSGEEKQEALNLRLYVDNDVVEVFANDRFALATMVYVRDAEADGIRLICGGEIGSVVVKDLSIWNLRENAG